MGAGEWLVCLLAQSHGNSSGACVLQNSRSTMSFAMTGAAIPHDATCHDVECELLSIACRQLRIIDSMLILHIDSLVTQLLIPSYKSIVRSPAGCAARCSLVGHRPCLRSPSATGPARDHGRRPSHDFCCQAVGL